MNARDWVLKGTSYKGQRLPQLLNALVPRACGARSQVLAVGCLAPAWHMPTNDSFASASRHVAQQSAAQTHLGASARLCACARLVCTVRT